MRAAILKALTVRLPEPLWRRLTDEAHDMGLSVAALVCFRLQGDYDAVDDMRRNAGGQ